MRLAPFRRALRRGVREYARVVQSLGQRLTRTRPAYDGEATSTLEIVGIVTDLAADATPGYFERGLLNMDSAEPKSVLLAAETDVLVGDLITIDEETWRVARVYSPLVDTEGEGIRLFVQAFLRRQGD